MKRVGENGEDRDEVDEDNLGDGPPILRLVDHSAGHGVEPVQGDGGQAERGYVDGHSLQITNFFSGILVFRNFASINPRGLSKII